MARIATGDLLDTLFDEGSVNSRSFTGDLPLQSPEWDPDYVGELRSAREKSGVDESITIGTARIDGIECIFVAGNFDFLAGSIGREAAARIVAAFDHALAHGLPVVGLPTSGGTRMQEGTPTFLLMAAIAAAVQRHHQADLPYLVYLRNPTTGGVFATWGSLGDLTFGEPGALTGFLGPRVYEGLYGRPFPEGVQSSEGLTQAGVIDGVATPEQFREVAAGAFRIWSRRAPIAAPAEPPESSAPSDQASNSPDAWECVLRTRAETRLGAGDLLSFADRVVRLSGDQAGGRAAATTLALVETAGTAFVWVAQDRAAQQRGHLVGPADLRVARRGMRLAESWGLPLVTVVDTQGGELSVEAEQGALAGEIARCLADLSALSVPTVSFLIGGGGGGAALALLPADRVLGAEDAWVTPLPAEGASLIRYRTLDRADEMARSQWITASDLFEIGAVDRLVNLPVDEAEGARDLADLLAAVRREVRAAQESQIDPGERARRWLAIGARPPRTSSGGAPERSQDQQR